VCGLQSTDDEAVSTAAPAQAGADQERAEHVSRELLPPPPSVHALRVRGALAALAHQPRPRGSHFIIYYLLLDFIYYYLYYIIIIFDFINYFILFSLWYVERGLFDARRLSAGREPSCRLAQRGSLREADGGMDSITHARARARAFSSSAG
jgi:hypothetical protein